ncbi:hypothetical protein EDL99_03830 [Ornithobacterium rhinotracheale]|uniref:gliding motility lipoprotein GldB n=1 Tax=Ornithobacterium rhinotracheale TaxID=28251 RepID=UPI00129CD6E6|nr:hypothetical protein [Ornithobacterium rhinotracheale]MRJ08018.1 hypothetical protein [Ornithobacterium rhinotracheale]UOH78475.1 hypothetical protein MT996_03160 [Ornithobacterium rhinotracheale]
MKRVFFYVILILSVVSCSKKPHEFQTEVPPFTDSIQVKDVSKAYYDTKISNQALAKLYPDFFADIPDTILESRRADTLAIALNQAVENQFKNLALKDSLRTIFKYVKYYYPNFTAPTVYTFTGELPYMNPVAYWVQSNDMVLGLDWFLGKDYPLYQKMGIPQYIRNKFRPQDLKISIAESMARQLVPMDITKRKFVEKMIYAGKVLLATQAFLPEKSAQEIMQYSSEQWQWCVDNEADMYVYFTESEYFFDEDKKLSERFIEPAPFSKFFTDTDNETPGRVGAWMGLQICHAYLKQNPKVDLATFLSDNDYLKIFKDSKYKPIK